MDINDIDFSFELDSLYEFFKGEDKDKIFNNFCNELLNTGWNVCADAKKYGVRSHIMNEDMINLYKNSKAFIYECIVDSLQEEKKYKDKFIINYIKNHLGDKKNKILCYGDGVGKDSQNHASNGHFVTYFDFESATSKYAQYQIEKFGLLSNITFIFNEQNIKFNEYNIVICREVLEHIENPYSIMQKLADYLEKDGICFLSESFFSVQKKYPTHLASNLKYVNKTIPMMINAGFIYLDKLDKTNLLVFKKSNLNHKNRYLTIPPKSLKAKLKKLIRNKLIYYLS